MALEVTDRQVSAVLDEQFPEAARRRLREWNLWRRCFREAAGDLVADALAQEEPDPKAVLVRALRRQGLEKADAAEVARRFPGLAAGQIQRRLARDEYLRAFRAQRWEGHLPRLFLKHRPVLDRIVYSLLRMRDGGLAMELYFRIQEGECTFSEAASQFSEGSEAHTGGILGPVPASAPHAELAAILAASAPGQLCPPKRMGEWFIVVRLEKRLPAQLDEPTSEWLLERCYEEWLDELWRAAEAGGDAAR